MLRYRKSPSADGIHPEVIKRSGSRLTEVLDTIVKDAWEDWEASADWRDVQLVTIFKKKDR